MNKKTILFCTCIALTLFLGCTQPPLMLQSVDLYQVDIGKVGKMHLEFHDLHTKLIKNNEGTAYPGIHHDFDEELILNSTIAENLSSNIINNLGKSPDIEFVSESSTADFLLKFELQQFDVFRTTSGGSAAAQILVGGLLGGVLSNEVYTCSINSLVTISDPTSGEILCSFDVSVEENRDDVKLNDPWNKYNDYKEGYEKAMHSATEELVKKLLFSLSEC
jgi:hypothetical protein